MEHGGFKVALCCKNAQMDLSSLMCGPKLGKDVFNTDMLEDAEKHIPPRHPSSCSHVAVVLEWEAEAPVLFLCQCWFLCDCFPCVIYPPPPPCHDHDRGATAQSEP